MFGSLHKHIHFLWSPSHSTALIPSSGLFIQIKHFAPKGKQEIHFMFSILSSNPNKEILSPPLVFSSQNPDFFGEMSFKTRGSEEGGDFKMVGNNLIGQISPVTEDWIFELWRLVLGSHDSPSWDRVSRPKLSPPLYVNCCGMFTCIIQKVLYTHTVSIFQLESGQIISEQNAFAKLEEILKGLSRD